MTYRYPATMTTRPLRAPPASSARAGLPGLPVSGAGIASIWSTSTAALVTVSATQEIEQRMAELARKREQSR